MRRPVKPPIPPAWLKVTSSCWHGSQELEMAPELLRYDVFLSFRGPDTRQDFTDVLYDHMVRAGLRVFRDDDELALGDKIDTIIDAISKSEICVPVFSETFAESKWCLREVKSMVDSNKTIVPIFYKVSVDDVKLKTPRYDEFMKKHQQTSRKEEVDEWKAALRTATENKGQVLSDQGYSDFCKDFKNQVRKRLGPRERVHADALIGVEDQIRRFKELLDVGSSGTVQYICIHGMGGIGKTALSKVIFNKFSSRFDSWKFIEDVREKCSRDPDWLNKLMDELKSHLEESIDGKKRMLIVLDDVDECKQIDPLVGQKFGYGTGSVIIVTTRDKDILLGCSGVARDQIIPFEMDFLQPQDALRLFCTKAFDGDTPPPGFESLSKDVVEITGRLPLALVRMSSLLRPKERKMWEVDIKRSKDILDEKVKKVLKISYDKLDRDQKQIFLDLACLPICRKEPSRMMVMWEACKFYPRYSLPVLESKSLIKTRGINWNDPLSEKYEKKNYEIWMHDLLSDLGRDIVSVNEEGLLPLKKRSRLLQDEAYEVLINQKGKRKKVEALSLGNSRLDGLHLEQQVGTLQNLRFLHHDDGFRSSFYEEDDLGNLFPELRYLRLYPSQEFHPRNLSMSNLVTLDLSPSDVSESWEGWTPIFKGAPNLKELILEYTGIKELPDINRLRKLERLSLYGCESLQLLPPSIGKLESLIVLDLRNTSIQVLPSSISALRNLEQLLIDNSYLREIPELPPNLHGLYVKSQKLEKIGNISRLNHLVYLTLVGGIQVATSNLDTIERFSNLKSLELCLDLPENVVLEINFSGLSHLNNLQLSCWNFEDLPLRLPSCLLSLKLSHVRSNAQVCSLPPILNKLTLSECPSLNLMEGLHLPQSIEYLEFHHCKHLEKLPDLSGCQNLQKLRLINCISLMEISIPRELKSLISLYIEKCISLEKIEGPFDLENLQDIGVNECHVSRDMQEFGTLQARRQDLKNLKDLILYLHKWSTPYFPGHITIERLVLKGSNYFRSIHDSIGNLKCLKHLELSGRYFSGVYVVSLPESIGALKSLVCLDVENINIRKLPSSISQLSSLQKLKLDGCHGLSELPELPISLCEIYVESKVLHKVYDISGLINLMHLKLVSAHPVETTNFEGVEKFSKLKSLVLKITFQVMTRQVNFSSLSELESLDLSCHNLKDHLQLPPRLSSLSLRHVNSETQLCSLPSSLKELVFSRWSKRGGYETLGMENLYLLERFWILKSNFNLMKGLYLPMNLRNLGFFKCKFLQKLPDLSNCVNLLELIVWRCINLMEVSIPQDLKSLRSLYIEACIPLNNEDISELKNVNVLNIKNCKAILDKWALNNIYEDDDDDEEEERRRKKKKEDEIS